jgi:hypothetical protein
MNAVILGILGILMITISVVLAVMGFNNQLTSFTGGMGWALAGLFQTVMTVYLVGQEI